MYSREQHGLMAEIGGEISATDCVRDEPAAQDASASQGRSLKLAPPWAKNGTCRASGAWGMATPLPVARRGRMGINFGAVTSDGKVVAMGVAALELPGGECKARSPSPTVSGSIR